MRSWLSIAAALSLGACAHDDTNPFHGSNQQGVVADGMSVTITNARSEADGKPLAEPYCNKFGRTARFNRIEAYRVHRAATDSAIFDCVPRSS
jgi:hypothetical protein